jgi:hypothetical protein
MAVRIGGYMKRLYEYESQVAYAIRIQTPTLSITQGL